MNELSNLKPSPGSVTRRKRVGRGTGSGKGKTSSRGQKGQKSRSGGSTARGFEGGQMPLHRRLPKRGFSNYGHKLLFTTVNVCQLEKFEDGATVDIDALKRVGLAKGDGVRVKITGAGDLTRKLVGALIVWRPGLWPSTRFSTGMLAQHYLQDAGDHRTGEFTVALFSQVSWDGIPKK